MSECFTCEMKAYSSDLSKAAWAMSSATTLANAKTVDDPPSLWAMAIIEKYHNNGHNWDEALRLAKETT